MTLVKDFNEGFKNIFTAFYFKNTGFGFNDDGKINVEFNTLNQNGINILETSIKI